ncbi:MAG: glycosyltransferase family 2 protein [Gammaproteobacteria bacterium]|nr:glycosyltransferase family 2 protein [Gammaproteobacteria bacterium]
MASPLISVVLITYNGQKHLRQQIDSIFGQTYKKIEIIVCDDCSTDETPLILSEYRHNQNFKVWINNSNLGFRKNFEQACCKASGLFIAPADQDDIWLPNKLEAMISKIDDNTLIYSNSRLMSEDGQLLDTTLDQRYSIKFVDGHCPRSFYLGNCVAAHTMLFRREIVEYISPIPDTLFHDQWVAFIAATLGTIKFLDQPLIHYRQHAQSVTGKASEPTTINFHQRYKNKYQRQKQRLDNKISYLQQMLDLQIRLEQPDPLLQKLIGYYKKHEKHIINWPILRLLIANRDQLFATSPRNPIQLAIKEAAGLRLYKSLP